LTDGSYFVQGHFTPESYAQFRKDNENLRATDLQDIMLKVVKWKAELIRTTDEDSFTSYDGVEMRLVIQKVEIMKDFSVKL
jgi:hypothetical protein